MAGTDLSGTSLWNVANVRDFKQAIDSIPQSILAMGTAFTSMARTANDAIGSVRKNLKGLQGDLQAAGLGGRRGLLGRGSGNGSIASGWSGGANPWGGSGSPTLDAVDALTNRPTWSAGGNGSNGSPPGVPTAGFSWGRLGAASLIGAAGAASNAVQPLIQQGITQSQLNTWLTTSTGGRLNSRWAMSQPNWAWASSTPQSLADYMSGLRTLGAGGFGPGTNVWQNRAAQTGALAAIGQNMGINTSFSQLAQFQQSFSSNAGYYGRMRAGLNPSNTNIFSNLQALTQQGLQGRSWTGQSVGNLFTQGTGAWTRLSALTGGNQDVMNTLVATAQRLGPQGMSALANAQTPQQISQALGRAHLGGTITSRLEKAQNAQANATADMANSAAMSYAQGKQLLANTEKMVTHLGGIKQVLDMMAAFGGLSAAGGGLIGAGINGVGAARGIGRAFGGLRGAGGGIAGEAESVAGSGLLGRLGGLATRIPGIGGLLGRAGGALGEAGFGSTGMMGIAGGGMVAAMGASTLWHSMHGKAGWGSLAGGIGGGAMTGAGIGMMFGPEGALIGGGIGAGVGALMQGARHWKGAVHGIESAAGWVGGLFGGHHHKKKQALGPVGGIGPQGLVGQSGGSVGMPTTAPASGGSSQVVGIAERYLGVPYLWGGTDPKRGLDCSGFTQLVYKQAGVNLPRTTYDQVKTGTAVANLGQAQAGDLLFYGRGPDHVGIYLGNNKMIDAPHTGSKVRIESVWTNDLSAIRREVAGNGNAGTSSTVGSVPVSSTSSPLGSVSVAGPGMLAGVGEGNSTVTEAATIASSMFATFSAPNMGSGTMSNGGAQGNTTSNGGSASGASSGGPVSGPIPTGQHLALIQQSLKLAGIQDTAANEAAVNTIATHESNWNAGAVNNWDSNAKAGHASEGIMQTIPSTFNAYALPGHKNILNALDNLIAGERYAVSRYGSLTNVPGVKAVAAGRAYIGYETGSQYIDRDQLAMLHRGEMVIRAGDAAARRMLQGSGRSAPMVNVEKGAITFQIATTPGGVGAPGSTSGLPSQQEMERSADYFWAHIERKQALAKVAGD